MTKDLLDSYDQVIEDVESLHDHDRGPTLLAELRGRRRDLQDCLSELEPEPTGVPLRPPLGETARIPDFTIPHRLLDSYFDRRRIKLKDHCAACGAIPVVLYTAVTGQYWCTKHSKTIGRGFEVSPVPAMFGATPPTDPAPASIPPRLCTICHKGISEAPGPEHYELAPDQPGYLKYDRLGGKWNTTHPTDPDQAIRCQACGTYGCLKHPDLDLDAVRMIPCPTCGMYGPCEHDEDPPGEDDHEQARRLR